MYAVAMEIERARAHGSVASRAEQKIRIQISG